MRTVNTEHRKADRITKKTALEMEKFCVRFLSKENGNNSTRLWSIRWILWSHRHHQHYHHSTIRPLLLRLLFTFVIVLILLLLPLLLLIVVFVIVIVVNVASTGFLLNPGKLYTPEKLFSDFLHRFNR